MSGKVAAQLEGPGNLDSIYIKREWVRLGVWCQRRDAEETDQFLLRITRTGGVSHIKNLVLCHYLQGQTDTFLQPHMNKWETFDIKKIFLLSLSKSTSFLSVTA